MAFLLRKIRQSKWYPDPRGSWPLERGLQADALGDLRTQRNKLSVFLVDEQRSNLERIATALAANARDWANLDYVMIDVNELASIHIKHELSPGDTPDNEVNAVHVDLMELSVSQLVHLALVFQKKGESNRFLRDDIAQKIVEGVRVGNIDRGRIKIRQNSSFWGKYMETNHSQE